MTSEHHRLVAAMRLERRECPMCGTPLRSVEVDGPREKLACTGKLCAYTTIVKR